MFRLGAMRILALESISKNEKREAKCPRGDTQSSGELFFSVLHRLNDFFNWNVSLRLQNVENVKFVHIAVRTKNLQNKKMRTFDFIHQFWAKNKKSAAEDFANTDAHSYQSHCRARIFQIFRISNWRSVNTRKEWELESRVQKQRGDQNNFFSEEKFESVFDRVKNHLSFLFWGFF